ncbi:MAG: hypothetical protein UD936_02395 [Acutalibacteraceae bacterium]|nr:hypothetical protein [Acutalibacteraceae bacterium]
MKDGLKILLHAFCSGNSWKDGTVSQDDFEYAKQAGYMFNYPKHQTHDEVINKLYALLAKINPEDVANAFLYSLSTRKLEYRSPLGSYYYAKAIPEHKSTEDNNNNHCHLCGWYAWKTTPDEYDMKHGLNVFNFERYKFGGVRHTFLDYALFDLEQFIKLPKATPNDNDIEIFKQILGCVDKLEKPDRAGKLRDLISKEKIFKCNKNEIGNILELLGICGVLASKDFPAYEDKFVNEYDRAPVEHKNDFSYPINRWTASDGINYTKLEKVFNLKLL